MICIILEVSGESDMIEIKDVRLNKDNLIKIKEIDNIFYNEDILTLDWYLERYNENHKGILLFDNDRCVGYLVSVPVKKELYDTIINGVITNDLYINPDMFVNESKYNYIVSIVLLEDYKNKGYGCQMLNNLFDNGKGNFCALTITNDGYKLANKYMNLIMNINSEVSVFKKEIKGELE